MNSNKLVINPDKTHLMVMANKNNNKRVEVSLQAGEYTIKPSETEKLLGGQLHQSLKWNKHLRDNKESLMNQLTSRINVLKSVSHGTSFGTRLMIADGIVMSKLTYLITCTVGWGTTVPFKFIASPAIVCSKGGFGVWMLGLAQEQIAEESGMAICKAVGVLPHSDAGTQHKTISIGVCTSPCPTTIPTEPEEQQLA